MSEPAKMIYLFLMSIIPTVPAAWLTFAEGAVYSGYDHGDRLWGISVTNDQQAAGAIMKVLGGTYLWLLIAVRFFRFTAHQRDDDLRERNRRRTITEGTLTVADVEAEFERAGDPPRERISGD
jgi:putative membrane protein